jgi:hypothetical protein
MLENS